MRSVPYYNLNGISDRVSLLIGPMVKAARVPASQTLFG
jgi:hypothetical protein